VTLSRRRMLAALGASAFAPAAAAHAQASGQGSTVRRLAALIRDNYQDPAKARALAAELERRATGGGYDGLSNEALASRLTTDLLELSRDKHMAVMAAPMGSPHASPASDPGFAAGLNYGVERVDRLKGNVGAIELTLFPSLSFGDRLLDRYAAAMALMSETRALIVDLRRHMGGEPAAIAYFVSYFFDRPRFLVNEIHYRKAGVEPHYTTPQPRGPRYGEARPVLLLTSSSTFSGGEEFAYDLQALKRARVVGEVTGGGANPNDAFDLGDGLVALIPNGFARNPITGTNWEGVGVKPDVPSSADAALPLAHRLALESALAQARTDSDRRSIESALKGLST
jgi:retinol-binding protein 3